MSDSPDPLESKDRIVPLTRLVAVCDADGYVVEDVIVDLDDAFNVNRARRGAVAVVAGRENLTEEAEEKEEDGERPAFRKTRAGGN